MSGPGPLQAILLALVQGITEFLPISSSAHLILASWALSWRDQGLAFDMATHVGSWAALVWCSRRQLLDEVSAWKRRESHLLVPLIVGTIPVIVGGLLLHGWVATAGRSPVLIAWTTIGFGLLLGLADRRAPATAAVAPERAVRWSEALIIGLAQAVALVPGTSRSGITITAALLLGFSRLEAARFSFLLAIPLGAAIAAKDGLDLLSSPTPVDWPILTLGVVVSALAAWAVIRLFLAWIEKRTMAPFVVYRLLLGIGILVLLSARG